MRNLRGMKEQPRLCCDERFLNERPSTDTNPKATYVNRLDISFIWTFGEDAGSTGSQDELVSPWQEPSI